MNATKPACGHSVLRAECDDCKALLGKWYKKIRDSDPAWRDIEYGLDCPERIYEPVKVDAINLEAQAYYDKVWAVHHDWTNSGRSKRDCLVAELHAKQDGEAGTVRGIAAVLKSKRLRPNSKSEVFKTIQEINRAILKKGQEHHIVEQGLKALRPVDSKPIREEANGQTDSDQRARPQAA